MSVLCVPNWSCHSCMAGMVEDLAGEQAVLCRGYERLHLRRSTGNEDGKIGLLDFAVFLVRTSVVREEVMVESPAQRVAQWP